MTRAHWGSRLAFILAAAGSAVGLGNIWKFPYITGINGGGLFVLAYLVCICLVGIPVLIAELYIGQKSQSNAVGAFETLDKAKTLWRSPGWLGLGSAFLILSFYSVIGGWLLYYTLLSVTGSLLAQPKNEIGEILNTLLASPGTQSLCHLLFLSLASAIVIGGVKAGLERWNKILMPTLVLLLILLLVRTSFLSGFGEAVTFLFSIHQGELTAHGLMEAVGHSFFTLSLGMGAMLTYGSYLSTRENIVRAAFSVAILDTLIALLAGVVIFSIVFSFGLEPSSGPGLIFATLPVLFAQLPGGTIIATAFFLLVFFAALTSAVSLLEVVVAYWTESHKAHRTKSTILSATAIFFLGLLSVFSTNILSEVKIAGLNFFDFFDKLTSSYMLPLGGVLISLFFGWKLAKSAIANDLKLNPVAGFCLLWITRVLAPIAIIIVLWNLISS